ncbi:hypothetical protein AC1031_003981 [Aphanomyces cochlioides]|nr:hypothetical protein AC1031_003981 [Aphanomyces cochlioides]
MGPHHDVPYKLKLQLYTTCWNSMRKASAPAIFFSVAVAGVAGVVYFVHDLQVREKKEMRAGVIRDIKRDRLRQQQEAREPAQ